jgi:hypothetical protein
MAKKSVGTGKVGRPPVPILKSRIEEAQRNTNSNRQAAIWLGVNYETYKRYAKIYGIFDRHANPLGLGTSKGYAKHPKSVALRDVFANKRPNYSMIRLKRRMLARGYLDEKCGMCGFEERRVTDNKSPLMLTFKNTQGDYSKDNLILMCYNCMFLTKGAPWVAHWRHIKASLTKPNYHSHRDDVDKYMDVLEDKNEEPIMKDDNWQQEILKELGRE